MQTIMICGNLTGDSEVVKGKDGSELMKFSVAVNDARSADGEKPTYYTCRMRKTGASEFLKKGRYVSVVGALKVSINVKDDNTYVNLDVWVSMLDFAPSKS